MASAIEVDTDVLKDSSRRRDGDSEEAMLEASIEFSESVEVAKRKVL